MLTKIKQALCRTKTIRNTPNMPQKNKDHQAMPVLYGTLILSIGVTISTANAAPTQYPNNNLATFDASVLGDLAAAKTKETIAHQLGLANNTYGNNHWNYQLNLRKPDTRTFIQCGVNINFNQSDSVMSIVLDKKDCVELANRYVTPIPNKPEPLVVFSHLPIERIVPSNQPIYTSDRVGQYKLNADLLFDFNSSIVKPKYIPQLQELAQLIKGKYQNISEIQVTGFTDRIGKVDYNYRLGMERANSVGFIFVNQGFGETVKVASMGESVANQTLCKNEKGTRLHDCLASDRRVEINVVGVAK